MTSKKLPDDETYVPPEGDDKLKTDKKKPVYTEDPNDPDYVEPRLRPDWDPSQPG